jgi:hypothetical protein
MKINRYSNFLNEGLSDLELSYYCFDWDDNLLHMPTKILMDQKVGDGWLPVEVSTSEFAVVRNDKQNYRLRNDDPREAFSEFRDFGSRGNRAFLEDTMDAVNQGRFGPSWEAFMKCLTEGSIFAIITARGHEPESMKVAVKYIIDSVLTDDQKFMMYSNCLKHAYIFSPYETEHIERIPKGKLSESPLIAEYLDSCDFYGVSSDSFASEFGQASASNPEMAKQQALDKFIEKCNRFGRKIGVKSVSVGFSDDDPKNVEHIQKYFKEKSALQYDEDHEMKLSLYKTTDPKLKGGKRTKFRGGEIQPIGESSHRAPGLDSSVVPFSKWTGDSQWRNPNNRDSPTDDQHHMLKNKTALAVDLYKEFAYNKKNKKRP